MKKLFSRLMTTAAVLSFGLVSNVSAQDMYSDYDEDQEATKIGITAALNNNFGAMGYQRNLVGNQVIFPEFDRVDGYGAGFYGGLFGEYDSGDWWGLQLRANYDSRFVTAIDNSDRQYDMHADYVTIEPLFQLRDVFHDDLYLQAGPVVAFNVRNDLDYYENSSGPLTDSREIPATRQTTYGVQGGLAYDIELDPSNDGQAWVFSPFIEGSWLVNQREDELPGRNEDDWDDTWSTPTLRAGIQFSSLFTEPAAIDFGEVEIDDLETMSLSVNTPYKGVVKARYVEEDFPLATAVFFEEDNDNIPSRYDLLSKSQAATFTEDKIIAPRELGTHTIEEINNHQMDVYHNIINIFADRMRENPEVSVTLVGGAPIEGDGIVLARSVRDYLVNTFGINSSRVKTQGRVIPPESSGTDRTPKEDWPLVNDENRKVEFVFSNPYIESPVVLTRMIQSPIDHDVVFSLGNEETVNSWNIYIEGSGKTLSYGPFYGKSVRVDPNVLLSGEDDGFYRAKAVVNTPDGRTVSEEKSFTLQREVMDDTEIMGERYSLLFDYDENDPEHIPFEEFLLTEVIPEIDENERVIVHGHTDVIGLADYNYELSLERAKTVKSIINRELQKKNVDAQVDAVGFGESDMRVTFDNSLPEGRYYNRNVIIEIIPNSEMSMK